MTTLFLKGYDDYKKNATRKQTTVHPVSITVIGPAFFPDDSYFRYFLDSSRRCGTDARLYGTGKPFASWIQTHINECLAVVSALQPLVVLYTDVRDVLCLAPKRELIEKYEAMDRPRFLAATETQGGITRVNFGGWMAHRYDAMFVLKQLRDEYSSYGDDPQERMRAFVRDNKCNIQLDHEREIFQCEDESRIEVKGSRIINLDTQKKPCFMHFNGGHHDREERMGPFLKQLGYQTGVQKW